jgi:signal peptidase I
MVAAGADGKPACMYPMYRESLPGGRSYRVLDQVDNPRADDVSEIVVPAGRMFLMGDNRDDSLDSRFSLQEGGIGFVPVENLIGRASFIFWSTDGAAEYSKPWTWWSGLHGNRLATGFHGQER